MLRTDPRRSACWRCACPVPCIAVFESHSCSASTSVQLLEADSLESLADLVRGKSPP